ncbi:PQQ-dependent sugar dehydrogenase [Amnibacterium endophyticum]|uniref:PQQ-dependent sugar dehydrogenase n=1 Tax=Amnibacterium endophyticum TaxID=2109337 RepID=A0ABW4L9S3_9MICO
MPAPRTALSRASIVIGALLVPVSLTACTQAPIGTPAPAASGIAVPTGTPTDVATGLEAPWEVVRYDGTPFISLRNSGEVLELLDDGSTRRVGVVPDVQHRGGEGGLLGMAVGQDGDLYTYSTAADGNRIERFAVTGGAGSYALGAERTVLDGLPSNTYHDGGRIAFGPDGMLYASVGDAGSGDLAQDRDAANGKILRMTPDGEVPDDNPFPDSLVYSLGHRNVQGLGWASDGTMFAAEFSQDTWDELNVIRPGQNYGWPIEEGRGDDDRFTDPVQQWNPDDASPSGLAVIDDTIFIANLRGQVLRAVPPDAPGTSRELYEGRYGRLRSVLAGPDDTLWIVTNNTDGRGNPDAGDDRILTVPLTSSS